MKQIRVAAVSYLNTKPLLHGIRQHQVMNQLSLIEDYPARIAEMLLKDEVDLALVPVAVIPRLQNPQIVSNYCIGAEGPVASVCIFSEVPIEDVTELFLDYQSKTSVNLAKVLLKEYWQRKVQLIDTNGEDFISAIKGTSAGVVIGDRALKQRLRSKYTYDLAATWVAHTGLPFVFAAWIANKPLPENFIAQFNDANEQGLQQLDEVIAGLPFLDYNLETYFKQNISYSLTNRKREGLQLFLDKLKELYR